MISLRTVPSSTALIVCASTGPAMATSSNRPVRTNLRELPATAFRRWVDRLGSVFGVDDFMAASFVGIFLTFDPSWLLGFRLFLVLIFAVQAARVKNFRRTSGPGGRSG